MLLKSACAFLRTGFQYKNWKLIVSLLRLIDKF
jgi:hypothetical protein